MQEKPKIVVSNKMFVGVAQGTLRDVYKIGRKLGEGSYGEVRKATHRASKARRAIKVLKKEMMNEEEQK